MSVELAQAPFSYKPEKPLESAYQRSRDEWDGRIGNAVVQAKNWRAAFFLTALMSFALLAFSIYQALSLKLIPVIVQVDGTSGEPKVLGELGKITYEPKTQEIKYFISTFLKSVRAIPADPVVFRQSWINAYLFLRPSASNELNAIAGSDEGNPVKRLGKQTVSVEPLSINQVGDSSSYQARWKETTFEKNGRLSEERIMTGVFTIEFDTPKDEKTLRENPLGLLSNTLNGAASFKREKYMKWSILIPILIFPAIAIADGQPNEAAVAVKAAELSKDLSEGEAKAREELKAKLKDQSAPRATAPKSGPQSESQSTLTSAKMIDALSSKVDELRAKESVTRYTAASTDGPRGRARVGAKTFYGYREGEIYELRAGVDRVTDVELQPGERLTNPPVSGDTVRWKIALLTGTEESGAITHIIVKPLEENIETNILLVTNKRTYHLRALSSDWYMPSIAWNYPDDDAKAISEKLKINEATEKVSVAPESLNFSYDIEDKSYDFKPIQVFDDGSKTYIRMRKDLASSELPALFVVSEDDEPVLTNYRVKGDYLIVDRLFESCELRVGKKRAIKVYRGKKPSFIEALF